MKIAIVGSGVSGLVAAYKLHPHHQVTVFESNDYVGGHTNTVDVTTSDGRTVPIDTGFIVYNEWTYPNFISLLDELQVESQPAEMSFSVQTQAGLEYNGHNLNTLFAQRRNLLNLRFHRMVRDILRFNKQARQALDHLDEETTIDEFLNEHGYGREFRDWYLLPMGAAIWSCPLGQFASFPIRFIVEFYANHGLLNVKNRPQWRVIGGGSQSYVRKLIAGFDDRIKTSTPVVGVERDQDQVKLRFGSGGTETFDHVIFACHADQALKILGDEASATERELLSAFPYSRNIAVLHTDQSVLPKSRRAWASWNYALTGDENSPVAVTYDMNILQSLNESETYCVTLNPHDGQIDPSKEIKSFVYDHPIFTTSRSRVQRRHNELINQHRTSYCGAYWRNGFHEDGVVSALAVCAGLGSADSPNASAADDSGRECLPGIGGQSR